MIKKTIILFFIVITGVLFFFPNFPSLAIKKISSDELLELNFKWKVFYQAEFRDDAGEFVSKSNARPISVIDEKTTISVLEFSNEYLVWEDEKLICLRLSKESLRSKGLDPKSVRLTFPSTIHAKIQRSSGGGPLIQVFNRIF